MAANFNQLYHDAIKSVNDMFGAMNALNLELETTKKELETTKKTLLKMKKAKNQQDTNYKKRLQLQETTIKELQQQIATLTPPPPFTLTQQTRIHDEMDEEGDVTLLAVDEDGL